MTFIKEEFFKYFYTENPKPKAINLDIVSTNEHALNFFKRNGFEYKNDYIKDFGTNGKKIIYNMMTYNNDRDNSFLF